MHLYIFLFGSKELQKALLEGVALVSIHEIKQGRGALH